MSVAAAVAESSETAAGWLQRLGSISPRSRSEQLAALVLRYALPAISAHREFTMAGGLFSYGTSLVDIYR